jgi:hypothetical protein
LDEGVLRCLFDVALVVEKAEQDGADAKLVPADDLGERLDVAVARPRKQRLVVPRHSRDRTGVVNRTGSSTHQRGMDWVLRPWVATCTETRDRLSAHLEGALAGREARRVLRHLARCPHCREALRSLSRTVDGLRALGGEDAHAPPRPSVVGAVVARIRNNRL